MHAHHAAVAESEAMMNERAFTKHSSNQGEAHGGADDGARHHYGANQPDQSTYA